MRRKSIATAGVCWALLCAGSPLAWAQTFSTGQSVFASPSGATNDWYSGCIVGSGRSNRSYQVECAGTTYWVSGEHLSTQAPAPAPDPMRPGQMLTPVVTPSHPVQAAVAGSTPGVAQNRAGPPTAAEATSGSYEGVISVEEMHRRIEQDEADAKAAELAVGKYSCYVGSRYIFTDLFITGPHVYRVEPGGTGNYDYAAGVLTFTSGPYVGAYSRMVDGTTVGISSDGNINLATQCGLTK